jgi:hypothetical protein
MKPDVADSLKVKEKPKRNHCNVTTAAARNDTKMSVLGC